MTEPPGAEHIRILEDRNNALIREQTGKDPSRLTEAEYQEALQAAHDRAAIDGASCFEDGRFIPGRFARVLLDRGYTFATLEDKEEILVYEPARGVYVPGESQVKALLQRAIEEKARTHWANEVLGHIQRSTYIPRESLNPPGALCLENGVLDLETKALRDQAPVPRYTRQHPVVFDAEAQCPAFLRFLEEILPDTELREEVQLLFGYCLKAGNWLQRAFLAWGGGNNGKSTLLRVLAALLGREAVAARTLQALSSDKFAASSLYGKLANICPDLPAAPVAYPGAFKALTGGDPVTGERKFQNAFTFVNEAVLIFSANQRPPVDDPTVAFWRRWVILPFEVTFEGREDRRLLGKLTTPAELSGVLNWALDGLRKLRNYGDFPIMESSETRKEEWKRQSDSLYWFVQECVDRDPDSWVVKRDFFQAYAEFCEMRDIQAKHPEAVGRELQRHIPQVRTYRPRGIKGRPPAWSGLSLRVRDESHPDLLDHLDRHASVGQGGQSGQGVPHLFFIEEEVHDILRRDPRIVPKFLSKRVLDNLWNATVFGGPVPRLAFEEVHRVVLEMHAALEGG